MTPNKLHPIYPIYIISKGRSETRYTMKALDRMGVFYRVAVEPQDYDLYLKYIPESQLLVLPFSNHGKGSGPARNWCWEHSKSEGHKRHWLMDDNIFDFWRYHYNKRIRCNTGAIFKAAEDYVDRYTNVPLSGFQYSFFYPDKCYKPPYTLNVRLMSCLLIENSCEHKWRARYNEDVDLSIRILKGGDCTIMFNAFLQGKAATGKIKGGNTEELYGDGTFEKSKMLVDLHPDVVTLVRRYDRWHHHVDMKSFKKNKLKFVEGFVMPKEADEYGMVLVNEYKTENQRIIDKFEMVDPKWKKLK
jgi:hypothetical protein